MDTTQKILVRVMHRYYGCDTGCCGHIVEIEDHTGKTREVGQFDFLHSFRDLSREEVIEKVKSEISKEYPQCLQSIDWDTLEIDEYLDFCR